MRRISIPLVTTVMAVALLMSASALAQGPHKGKGKNMPTFAECDLDGDGTITKDEFYKARAERIAQRAQEGRKMKNLDKAPPFEDVDANGDGGVSRDEFLTHQAEHKAKMKQTQGKREQS